MYQEIGIYQKLIIRAVLHRKFPILHHNFWKISNYPFWSTKKVYDVDFYICEIDLSSWTKSIHIRYDISIVTNSRHYLILKRFYNQTITPRVNRYLRRMSVVTGRSSCRGLMVISQMTNSFNHQSKKMIFDDSNTAKHWRHPSINKATMKFIYGYNCIYLYRTTLTICFCVFGASSISLMTIK